MTFFLRFFQVQIVLFSFTLLSTNLFAQPAQIPYHVEPYELESGYFDGSGTLGANPKEVFTGYVEIHDVPWIQLHFLDFNLGKKSYLIIRSLKDNLWQKLDAVSIEQWQHFSAFFNGNAVEIKLFAAPGDRELFIKINQVVVGEWMIGDPFLSICGPTDDRIPSDQPATGRLLNVGCTAWIIPNGKFVSAGHCLDGSSSNVVEFNVPPSLPGGQIQHPGPEDQYSVDVSTKIFTDGGIGNDWGVFEVFPNSVTGLMPKEAQNAYWPLVQDLGPDSIRITGYGVDDGIANQTQQTHIGPNAGSSGTTMRYVTDTQGGNSGSPVIDGLNNVAVGVHTHGGCTSSGGNNNGTSTFHAAFWAAVDQGSGGCPVELPSNPNPPHASNGVSIDLTELTWTNGTGAVTNELYFGTDPGSLNLVQSGTLATNWTITGGPLDYGTTYYWQVVELGDTCNTNGSVWNFTTMTHPSVIFFEPFLDLSCWTPIGPLGLTNWASASSNNAGGVSPELQFSWTPSFNGLSQILSCDITGSNAHNHELSFKHYLDDYSATPSPFIGVAISYDGGTTSSTLWEVLPTGNIGPETVTVNFATPVMSDAVDFQLIFYTNGNSFNIDYWYIDDVMVTDLDWVPVELSSFSASANEGAVELSWITSTETNNSGFEIQRGTNGDFETIAFINGKGTTTEPQAYSFTDEKVSAGILNYRLKQIDFDGTFEYSNVVEVDVPAPSSFVLEQNYPNPFNPSTTIKFALPVETEIQLSVYNTIGEKVADVFNGNLKEGYHEVVFDASSLTSGTYFYRLEANDFVDVKKMLILK
jgi:V8-like Glu-specific endopeptidase